MAGFLKGAANAAKTMSGVMAAAKPAPPAKGIPLRKAPEAGTNSPAVGMPFALPAGNQFGIQSGGGANRIAQPAGGGFASLLQRLRGFRGR